MYFEREQKVANFKAKKQVENAKSAAAIALEKKEAKKAALEKEKDDNKEDDDDGDGISKLGYDGKKV